MQEDKSLDHLMAQFRQLEKSSVSLETNGPSLVKWNGYIKTYGIYALFFLWTFIVILALQPSYLFKKIEGSEKYKFLWKRFFLVLFIVYCALILTYLGFEYYCKKI